MDSKSKEGGEWLQGRIEKKGKQRKSLALRTFLSLMRSSSRKLQIISFHNWANLAASLLLLAETYTSMETKMKMSEHIYPKVLSYENVVGTSANCFEKENLPFCLFEGTKYVLNAPGNDWNRDLSMLIVRICGKQIDYINWLLRLWVKIFHFYESINVTHFKFIYKMKRKVQVSLQIGHFGISKKI